MSFVKAYGIAGFIAAATLFSAAPGHAVGLAAGASSARLAAGDTGLVQVQYVQRRARVVNRAPVVHRHVNRGNRVATRRAIALGVGAAAVVGAVAAANARPRYRHSAPYYSDPYAYPVAQRHYAPVHAAPVYTAPVCRMRNEELYNRNGVYRGVFQVRDCR